MRELTATSARRLASRLRNFVIDVVLVGGAVSYASGVAQAWLLDHETVLAHIAGGLHMVMLPLLLLAILVDVRERGKVARHALLWSLIAFYSLGFIVPLSIDDHAGVGDPVRSFTMLGQVVVAIGSLVALMKLDPTRVIARAQSHVVRWSVSLGAGAYLLCLEAALMAISHGDHPFAGPTGLVACAIAGYLPVRVYLAVALEGRKWDLVAMAIAFVHFIWRILT